MGIYGEYQVYLHTAARGWINNKEKDYYKQKKASKLPTLHANSLTVNMQSA